MSWHVAVVNGLAHAAVGGTLFLAAGFLAVLACRQPIRRIRLIELTLLGSLAVPVASQLPWLPHWSTGLLDLSTPVAGPQGAADSRAEPVAAMSAPVPLVPANTAPAATPLPVRVAPPRLEAEAISPVEAEALSPAALIAVGYGAVVAGLLAWFAFGVLSLAKLYRSTYPVPQEVWELFQAIAGPAGDTVSLRASDRVELPLAFRGRRPIIVLPGSLCRSADDPALHYSLAHEWSHVEGGDVSRWYLTSLAQFLYFFNPLFWWLRRQLRLCQDYLADARAAEHARQTEDYAAYLVGLAQSRLTVPAAALGIGDRRSNLYRRIIMLLQKRQSLERRCLKTWTAGTMVVGLAVLLVCSSIRLDAGTPADDDKTPAPKVTPQATEKAETLHYTGRVFDKDTGKSIAGATVTVRRSLLGDPESKEQNPIMEETKHQTDADGKYSFTIPPEQTSKRYLYIELDVEHPEYAPRSHFGYALSMIRKNEKIGSRPFFENVDLRQGKPIIGTVRTREGKPQAGVRVQAYSVTNSEQDRFEYGSFTDGRTDATGQFLLVVTTPGAAVVWIFPEEFAPSIHRVPDEKRGDLGTFTLNPGVRVRGKVLDVRGQPLAGVNVNAERRGGEELQGLMVAGMLSRSAVTNDQGEFIMKPLPPGAIEVQPGDHARDGSGPRDKRYPVPGVFVRQKVVLAEDSPPLEIRAVPHVVIEAQYYDSKGKKSRGHGGHIFGQMDKTSWFAETKVDAGGKMTVIVPHGLENARLSLTTNEHGSLRFRRTKDEPLTFGRDMELGTLNEDVRGIEIIHYKAPMVVVKVAAKDGEKLAGVKLAGIYKSGKGPRPQPVNGPPSDVHFDHQEDGRYHTFQLLPDEDVEITAQATGYQSQTISLRLPEGDTRELEMVLEK